MKPVEGGVAYRVHRNDLIILTATPLATGFVIEGQCRVVYDDGEWDTFTFAPITTTAGTNANSGGDHVCKADGWLVSAWAYPTTSPPDGSIWAQIQIVRGMEKGGPAGSNVLTTAAEGFINAYQGLQLDQSHPREYANGATWVFQGTVAEDATAGTHVSTITITPAVGNGIELAFGSIVTGATATAQTADAIIDDGTNLITSVFNAEKIAESSASTVYPFPMPNATPATFLTNISGLQSFIPVRISGTMRLILRVSTTAVSVTQTFAVSCRLKGTALPTVALADSVGTPTLTTNTNAVF